MKREKKEEDTESVRNRRKREKKVIDIASREKTGGSERGIKREERERMTATEM